MIKTISYLGLGTMGSGMASNLLKASYQLTVWNRSTGKYEPFARKGARVANFRSPLLVSNGQNILKRDFSPSFALKLMLKHAGLIENFGNNLQSPIPALRVAEKNLASAVALGFGNENASALIKALEKEAGVEVKARRARRSAIEGHNSFINPTEKNRFCEHRDAAYTAFLSETRFAPWCNHSRDRHANCRL